jgi:hypothetical protein
MSVLFHPSLGRFSDPAEVSGSDSDAYYTGRIRRTMEQSERRSRREEIGAGIPGTRRHQRWKNATLSNWESEYETGREQESDTVGMEAMEEESSG